MHSTQRFLIALCATLVACGKTDATRAPKPGNDSAAASPAKGSKPDTTDMPGMAGMPGMEPSGDSTTKKESGNAIATELTLTAAQIQHGGVKWAAVTIGNATSRAVV